MNTQLKKSGILSTSLAILGLVAILSLTYSTKIKAQEEIAGEEEIELPQTNSSTQAPPIILDESDSSSVQDVEDYEVQE